MKSQRELSLLLQYVYPEHLPVGASREPPTSCDPSPVPATEASFRVFVRMQRAAPVKESPEVPAEGRRLRPLHCREERYGAAWSVVSGDLRNAVWLPDTAREQ